MICFQIYLQNNFTKATYDVLKRFHFLLSGLDVDQLKQIVIDSADKLDTLGNVQDWDTEQVKLHFFDPQM